MNLVVRLCAVVGIAGSRTDHHAGRLCRIDCTGERITERLALTAEAHVDDIDAQLHCVLQCRKRSIRADRTAHTETDAHKDDLCILCDAGDRCTVRIGKGVARRNAGNVCAVVVILVRHTAVNIRIHIVCGKRDFAAEICLFRINIQIEANLFRDLCDTLLGERGLEVFVECGEHRVRHIKLGVNDGDDLSLAGTAGLVIIRREAGHSRCLCHLRGDLFRNRADIRDSVELLCFLDQIFGKLAGKAVDQRAIGIADIQFRKQCLERLLHGSLLCRDLRSLCRGVAAEQIVNGSAAAEQRIALDHHNHGNQFFVSGFHSIDCLNLGSCGTECRCSGGEQAGAADRCSSSHAQGFDDDSVLQFIHPFCIWRTSRLCGLCFRLHPAKAVTLL